MLLFLFTILFYARSYNYGFYFDDRSQVLEGKLIRSWNSVPQLFKAPVWQNVDTARSEQNVRLDTYRPFFNLSLLVDFQKGGLSSWTFHSTNVILHALVGTILFLLLTALGLSGLWSSLGALLFLVHPIVLTPVNYVSARADSLCALFCLSSIYALVRFESCKNVRGKVFVVAASAVFYGASLLSKETGILLPFILLPLVWNFDVPKRNKIAILTTMLATTIVYFVCRKHFLGASKVAADSSHLVRVAVHFPWVVMHFFRQVAWPTLAYPLVRFYPVVANSLHLGISLLFYLFTTVVMTFMFFSRKGRAMAWPLLLCLGTLLPPMIAVVNTEVIDGHYLYLPFLGFVLCLSVSARVAKVKVSSKSPLLAAILLVFLAVKSFYVCEDFRSELTFYQAIVRTGRPVSIAYLNLGNSWFRAGEWNNAIDAYEAYEKRFPVTEKILNNKGVALMNAGRLSEAEKTLLRGIALFPQHPKNHFNLALVYEKSNRVPDALRQLKMALTLQPGYAEARNEISSLCGTHRKHCRH